ncbi:MAG: HEPN domain-containing protein [Bacteroidota bacterium]
MRARKSPNYDAVCFHAQQCAEKYLKAVLQESGTRIPKIHFLLELLGMIIKIDGSYEFLKADLETLEEYAVRFRYPGHFAEKEEAQVAYAATGAVRKFCRQKMIWSDGSIYQQRSLAD